MSMRISTNNRLIISTTNLFYCKHRKRFVDDHLETIFIIHINLFENRYVKEILTFSNHKENMQINPTNLINLNFGLHLSYSLNY